MKTSEYLKSARGLIDTPGRWTQHVCGRDAAGNEVGSATFHEGDTEHVVSRCSLAALVTVEPERGAALNGAFWVLSRAILGTVDKAGVIDWNNAPERTHAEVLAAFDTAISYAEAAEQEFSPGACTPVEFDTLPMGDVQAALGRIWESEVSPMDQAAWERAWEDMA